MMEAIRSSESSVLTRATQPRIAEDGILHSHRRENLKSYNYAKSGIDSSCLRPRGGCDRLVKYLPFSKIKGERILAMYFLFSDVTVIFQRTRPVRIQFYAVWWSPKLVDSTEHLSASGWAAGVSFHTELYWSLSRPKIRTSTEMFT
jgi:hypothetical protein